VSVAEWIDLAAAAAPDVIFMLSDEISSVSTGGGSRTQKSIDRSGRWCLQQLAALRAHPSLQACPPNAVKCARVLRFSLQHTAVFAAVQGGNSLGNRARACTSISAMKVAASPL
jgi:queuine/archaeosine tRNA-ribosyltransferase